MSSDNKSLLNARREKNAEYYTQIETINDELRHYKNELFYDKVIYCPCDLYETDRYSLPIPSNFIAFFIKKAKDYKFKRLIATYPIEYNSKSKIHNYFEYIRQPDGTYIEQLGNCVSDAEYESGDFRSSFCTNLLKQSDIVITNPPFHLIDSFVDWILKQQKQFLIIGNHNAVTHNYFFNKIRTGEIAIGYEYNNFDFILPDDIPIDKSKTGIIKKGAKYYQHIGEACWFTNLPIYKRVDFSTLTNSYYKHVDNYPRYNFYDVIFVDKQVNIPMDYFGAMAVPISFLKNFNTNQFELLDANDFIIPTYETPIRRKKHGLIKDKEAQLGNKVKYARLVIRRKVN